MKKQEQDIMKADEQAATIQTYSKANPIAALLNAAVEKGLTTENSSVMKDLFDLYERMNIQIAKQAFNEAMTAMQAEMPKVIARHEIPGNNNNVRSKFADRTDIMETVGPVLAKHGFSVGFDTRRADGLLIGICKIRHAGGHSETNEFAVRTGKGPPGCSDAQADGSANTYACRYALCNALNIVIGKDDDARTLGDFISPEQAMMLRERAEACGADIGRLLKFAEAESFEDIRTDKLKPVSDALAVKEKAKKRPQNADASFADEMVAAMSKEGKR